MNPTAGQAQQCRHNNKAKQLLATLKRRVMHFNIREHKRHLNYILADSKT